MATAIMTSDIVLTTGAVAFVISAVGSSSTVIKASALNTDASDHTVTVYRVPSGGSAGTANEILSAVNVPAGQQVILLISGQAVINGASLQALASAGAVVNLNATYVTS